MNRNSIICQCNVDPTVFFYFSGKKSHRKLGLYLVDNFAHGNIIQTNENTNKSKLFFTPATSEASDSIFLEESSVEDLFQFFPTFSWSRNSIVGAFTTGISQKIRILSLTRGQIEISEKIDIPNYFCSCLDFNNNENLHLLASSNIKYCNFQHFSQGFISIIDINTKQKIVKFHNKLNFDRSNNVFGYPSNVKWINSNFLVSGWKFCDFSSQLHFHDIRIKDSIFVTNVVKSCNEFLSVSQPGGNYLLASNLNNNISLFDIRLMKNEIRQNNIRTINSIYFNDHEINDLQWFPNEKHDISIFTSDGIFITRLSHRTHSHISFEANKSDRYSENIDIEWNDRLLENFKPLNLRENFSDTFCWVDSLSRSNIRHSLVYTDSESAYLISNLDVKINSFVSFHSTQLSHSMNEKNKSKQSNYEVLNFSKLFGYSWVPYRLMKYYKDDNTKIEEYNCIELLRRLENLNSAEARNLVLNQNDQNTLTNIGIFPKAGDNVNNIIKMMKSASHAFNYLSTLPDHIVHWKDLLRQLNKQKSSFINEKIPIFKKLILPAIRDLIYTFKYLTENIDISSQLKFINVKHEDSEAKSCKDSNKKENLNHIEVFSSSLREKLINLFGVSSFMIETPFFIDNNDPRQLESFFTAFFWNCITLQYHNFISHGDKLSNILDNFIENENKLLKTSFLKNIKLFFNSAGIFISNLYYSEGLSKISLSKEDIQFYYYSIISTSEHLLDEDYYLPIWNSNIHLESTLQLSIRFIVTFSKFISTNEQSQQFSSYLLEELLVPSMEINTYIYIPVNLLLLIGIYYLKLEEISHLIEIMIRKVAKNGFLDGITILGFNTFTDETYLMINLPENQNSEHMDVIFGNSNFDGNTDSTCLESDSNKNKNISYNSSSDVFLKQIFHNYLSFSFGDIQTVALIGSCIPNLTYGFNTNMELLEVCINEYKNLLKNNSLIYYLINNSNAMNLSINGSKPTKFNKNVSSILYELNILRSSYYKIIQIDQDELKSPIPTGNVLFCYYCEQPLHQSYFEHNYLLDKMILRPDCNSVISQSYKADFNEIQTEKKELNIKNIYNRDSQVGYPLRRASKNITSMNNLIQSEISTSSDLSSMILNCPNKYCNKPLPRCVICLAEMSINVINISVNDEATRKDYNQPYNYNISKWYTWCLHCHHGGCFKHISEWFECFDECPVPECNCWCNSVDHWYKL
ncbi:COOH terminal-specific cysteine rich domain-containing protein [Cryptosporidium ubiquitum]|uniref:COOH terminal-specific cysteine rich domain-containing protein n=1 Tax=Cryptosporidium ubiquitum TaxID=857276 RepID=A0A1J4MJ60_9CRYT|nr:COOH terminal-specific cysteine rich domain-containing protein [Cryptosporidium ubiquitum]OII74265.1 COOH terminal-specific cysteine rich domain-containing protein [Cryptosporidium ubiquitum]